MDPGPDPGGQKWPTKIEKKERNFIFCSAGYGCLGISKLQFLIQKISKKFFSCKFLFNFWPSKPWIRIVIQLKMLDADPDPDSMNPDPKQLNICYSRKILCRVVLVENCRYIANRSIHASSWLKSIQVETIKKSVYKNSLQNKIQKIVLCSCDRYIHPQFLVQCCS